MSRADPRQFQRLSELFARACDLPEAERRALIDRECADEPALREQLAALLHLDSATSDRFESSPMIPDVANVVRRLAQMEEDQVTLPMQLGRYRLLRVLASGGMGTVYEAEQDSPRRAVAVKLIRPGLVSQHMLRRFRHEGEILGTLHHPGVAQVYDAGTAEVATRGGVIRTPFIAMELVAGQNLLAYAADLPVPEKLNLLIRVCDAVQHAHQKGVIHRDLKPGNILVEPSGQPKILDFGIARLDSPGHAATLNTTPGQIVGTLAYMSPEQVAGDPRQIDSRSDVYSLGVVLYQLLTGRLPLGVETTSIAEAARIIRDDDPAPLASADPRFRGDLDTISAKALHKKREDRYQSAADLGGDLRRFLAHEPILARPASAAYILRKFARRHRALVAGAAAAAVALLIGAIGTVIFAVQAERARVLAVTNERAMRREAALSAEAAGFMKEMLSGVRPAVAAGRDRTMLREILDRTVARIGAGELAEHPRVEAEIRSTIGGAYRDIGDLARAAEMIEGALNALDRAEEAQPLLRATVLDQLATIRQDQGRLGEAEGLYARAVQMLDARPDSPQEVQDLGQRITGNLAGLRRLQGKPAEAERLLRQVLEWSIRRFGPRDAKIATYTHNLGGALADQQQLPEAEKYYREALTLLRAAHGDIHPFVATASENLGNVLMWQLKFDEADVILTDAVRIHLASQGDNNLQVARGRSNLADLRRNQNRPADAAELYTQAIEGFQRSLPPNHLYTCLARTRLALSMAALGNFAAAEPIFLEGYLPMVEDPEVPEPLKATTNGELLWFYEHWDAAAPSGEPGVKLNQWRAKLRPAGSQ